MNADKKGWILICARGLILGLDGLFLLMCHLPVQGININSVPILISQLTIPPPPSTPAPEPSPIPPQQLETPLQLPSPSPPPTELSTESLVVTAFEFTGNTVFTSEQLGTILISIDGNLVPITSIQSQPFTLTQLLQIAEQVVDFYHQQGYQTTGAIIVLPIETRQQGAGIVKIKVIEGILQQITIKLKNKDRGGRLKNYLRSRLGVKLNQPLNVKQLLEALQLLQLDPLIASISAQLSPGTEQGKSILDIQYQPADSFSLTLGGNNNSSPSIGTFQRGVTVRQENLLGFGDNVSFDYHNTNGSDRWQSRYQIPINKNNGSLEFEYVENTNVVIEEPFYDIDLDGNGPDITTNYNSYELTYRQPISRFIKNQTYQEIALGFSLSLLRNQSLLLEEFPLSVSADDNGETNEFVLRFAQEFTQQNPQDVLALRSQFSLGLGLFDATIKDHVPGIGEIPDSRFLDWRFQGQYVRLLAPDTLFLIQSFFQISDSPLLAAEQFSIGGVGTVRSYRQDEILTDNGLLLSIEGRIPILKIRSWQGILQITPFIDYGLGWNVNEINPNPNNLAAIGVGLLWRQPNFSARLDWGIPLVNVDRRDKTWQENGFYFSVQYSPF